MLFFCVFKNDMISKTHLKSENYSEHIVHWLKQKHHFEYLKGKMSTCVSILHGLSDHIKSLRNVRGVPVCETWVWYKWLKV